MVNFENVNVGWEKTQYDALGHPTFNARQIRQK